LAVGAELQLRPLLAGESEDSPLHSTAFIKLLARNGAKGVSKFLLFLAPFFAMFDHDGFATE
jgi:hypothetical protein